MQRVLRIVLIITSMLLLILWFSTIFNTCNKNKTQDSASDGLAEATDTSDVFEDLGDDFFEDGSGLAEDQSGNNESSVDLFEESNTGDISSGTTEDTEAFTDYTGTAPEPTASTSVRSTPSGTQSGRYLIVAGSFLVEGNAIEMKNKLEAMGYPAEVRNFNFSQYYSVIAGRYENQSTANRVAGEIKSKGIDCYVHKRQN